MLFLSQVRDIAGFRCVCVDIKTQICYWCQLGSSILYILLHVFSPQTVCKLHLQNGRWRPKPLVSASTSWPSWSSCGPRFAAPKGGDWRLVWDWIWGIGFTSGVNHHPFGTPFLMCVCKHSNFCWAGCEELRVWYTVWRVNPCFPFAFAEDNLMSMVVPLILVDKCPQTMFQS